MSAEVSGSLISQLKDAVDRRADSDWDGRGASASSDKRDFINPTRVASGSLSSRKSVGTDFDPDDGKWIVPTEEEASDDKLGKMSSKPRRASSQKILSSPRTSGSRSVHRSSEVLLNIKSVVQEWSSLTHVEVIHRQGIHAPPLMFEYEQGSPRPVFRTFLPAKDLSESYLYCRKKQKEEIFRFSMDANNMQKHRNPKYVATMAVDACDPFHFRLYNKLEVCVADIKINPMKKKVTVILVNEYLNVYEKGFSGRTLVGEIRTFLQPMLSVKVEKSERVAMEISNSNDGMDPAKFNKNQVKYLIEYDYPLSILVVFATACAVEYKAVLSRKLH